MGTPKGGVGPTLASLGFATPADGGIYPAAAPGVEGVPTIALNNYSFGVNGFPNYQVNNTFQWQDDFSKIVGAHSLKFGLDYHYDQIRSNFYFGYSNGAFFISGTETGLDF